MTEEEKDAYLKKLVQSNIDQHNKITALSKKVYDLQKESYRKEAQIEKMKCCSNCDNWNWKHNKCEKKLKGDCFKHSKWVMRNF